MFWRKISLEFFWKNWFHFPSSQLFSRMSYSLIIETSKLTLFRNRACDDASFWGAACLQGASISYTVVKNNKTGLISRRENRIVHVLWYKILGCYYNILGCYYNNLGCYYNILGWKFVMIFKWEKNLFWTNKKFVYKIFIPKYCNIIPK